MRDANPRGAWTVALRSRDVRLLVAAFAAFTVAEWMVVAALAVHLYDAGGEAAVALLAVCFVPTALAGLAAGALIELRPPERVLTATALAQALAIGAAALALMLDWPLGVVVAIVGVEAALAAAYRPAQAAILPVLARSPAELTAAVGVLTVMRTVCQAAGIFLGGFLVAELPADSVFATASGLFVIATALTAGLGVRTELVVPGGAGAARAQAAGAGGALGAARHGLRVLAEIAAAPDSRLVIGLAGLRAAVRGAWLALAVLAAIGFLGMGREGVGELAAAAGVGALVSVLISPGLVSSPRLAAGLGAALLLVGGSLAGIAAIATPGAALVLLVAWGVGMAIADLCATAALPRIVDARRFGHLTAATESFKQTAEGVGSLVAPLAAAAIGTRGTLAAVGLAVCAIPPAAWHILARVDAAADRRVGRIETIRSAPLFASLRIAELEAVAASVTPRHAGRGQDVIREGDLDPRTFFVIDRGEAAVLVDENLLRTLGPGQSFGEIALLHGLQRTATVRARSPLDLLELERADFLRALTGSQHSALRRRRERSAGDLSRLSTVEVLRHVPWIARLSDGALRHLADRARRRSAGAGEVLWRKGEPGESVVVVISGRLAVEAAEAIRATIGPGECAGEVALLHEVPRTATVRTRTATELYELHRDDVEGALAIDGTSSARLVEQLA